VRRLRGLERHRVLQRARPSPCERACGALNASYSTLMESRGQRVRRLKRCARVPGIQLRVRAKREFLLRHGLVKRLSPFLRRRHSCSARCTTQTGYIWQSKGLHGAQERANSRPTTCLARRACRTTHATPHAARPRAARQPSFSVPSAHGRHQVHLIGLCDGSAGTFLVIAILTPCGPPRADPAFATPPKNRGRRLRPRIAPAARARTSKGKRKCLGRRAAESRPPGASNTR